MDIAKRWEDFELLDAGNGEKLERWGDWVLRRPDPQAIWTHPKWETADAHYTRSSTGGGSWNLDNKEMPKSWVVNYPSVAGKLQFNVSLMGFKHTGLFPEQAVNWDFMQNCILKAKDKKEIKILNLFAYSGAASVACAAAGAHEVVHVDASKRMNQLAKQNLISSGLEDKTVRFMADDVNKFVEREMRRGRTYDGIIMDPPAYGRGPSGELWKLEDSVFDLVKKASQLLSKDAIFFVLNAYTTGLSAGVLYNLLRLNLGDRGGQFFADEIGLPATNRPIYLPAGSTGRWSLD